MDIIKWIKNLKDCCCFHLSRKKIYEK